MTITRSKPLRRIRGVSSKKETEGSSWLFRDLRELFFTPLNGVLDTSLDKLDFKAIVTLGTVFSGFLFLCGFLVQSLHNLSLGITTPDLLNIELIETGLCFLFFVFAPFGIAANILVNEIVFDPKNTWIFIVYTLVDGFLTITFVICLGLTFFLVAPNEYANHRLLSNLHSSIPLSTIAPIGQAAFILFIGALVGCIHWVLWNQAINNSQSKSDLITRQQMINLCNMWLQLALLGIIIFTYNHNGLYTLFFDFLLRAYLPVALCAIGSIGLACIVLAYTRLAPPGTLHTAMQLIASLLIAVGFYATVEAYTYYVHPLIPANRGGGLPVRAVQIIAQPNSLQSEAYWLVKNDPDGENVTSIHGNGFAANDAHSAHLRRLTGEKETLYILDMNNETIFYAFHDDIKKTWGRGYPEIHSLHHSFVRRIEHCDPPSHLEAWNATGEGPLSLQREALKRMNWWSEGDSHPAK